MFESAAASATADPEMPAKNTLVRMLTCPNPPRRRPTSAMERFIRARVMPARFMISPARMNSGMAISANTLIWEKIFCGRMARYRLLSVAIKASTAAPPIT